ILALGAIVHWWLSFRAFLRRLAAKFRRHGDYEFEVLERSGGWRRAAERVESAERAEAGIDAGSQARVEPEFFAGREDEFDQIDSYDAFADADDYETGQDAPRRAPAPASASAQVRQPRPAETPARVEGPAPRP